MKIALQVLRQRVTYFLHGNVHGVSANWLSKRVDKSLSNYSELLGILNFKFPFSESYLVDGSHLFDEVSESKSGKNYSPNYDCEQGMAAFLYGSILALRPKIVVETGIANGISTNIIMKALEQTGGTLHSFDVDPKTSNVYKGIGNWEFHLLRGNLKKVFLQEISKLGEIDYWIHDSNHGYSWQSFEYQLATSALNIEGILVSDDVDASTAFGLMDKSSYAITVVVFDERKMFGIAQRGVGRP